MIKPVFNIKVMILFITILDLESRIEKMFGVILKALKELNKIMFFMCRMWSVA